MESLSDVSRQEEERTLTILAFSQALMKAIDIHCSGKLIPADIIAMCPVQAAALNNNHFEEQFQNVVQTTAAARDRQLQAGPPAAVPARNHEGLLESHAKV